MAVVRAWAKVEHGRLDVAIRTFRKRSLDSGHLRSERLRCKHPKKSDRIRYKKHLAEQKRVRRERVAARKDRQYALRHYL